MSEFVTAGHVKRLDRERVGIHIDPDAYELEARALSHVMAYGSTEGLYQQISQSTFEGSGIKTGLQQAGTVKLSKTKRVVTVRLQNGRLFVINAAALRDVMHDKIPQAAVSEIVNSPTKKQQAASA